MINNRKQATYLQVHAEAALWMHFLGQGKTPENCRWWHGNPVELLAIARATSERTKAEHGCRTNNSWLLPVDFIWYDHANLHWSYESWCARGKFQLSFQPVRLSTCCQGKVLIASKLVRLPFAWAWWYHDNTCCARGIPSSLRISHSPDHPEKFP